MEYRGKVGAWLRRALVLIGVQGEALPLPESEPFPIRQTLTAIRLGQHVVPTLPEAVGKGDRGPGCWRGGAATVIRTLNSELFYCCPASAEPETPDHDHGGGVELAVAEELATEVRTEGGVLSAEAVTDVLVGAHGAGAVLDDVQGFGVLQG